MGKGSSEAGGGNSKYHGFSLTDAQGNTEQYIVASGQIQYADGRPRNIMGVDKLEVIQQAYDTYGSVSNLINRVNSIGSGKAAVLSDKSVDTLQKKRQADLANNRKQQATNAYKRKKGVNRHRLYWSAM